MRWLWNTFLFIGFVFLFTLLVAAQSPSQPAQHSDPRWERVKSLPAASELDISQKDGMRISCQLNWVTDDSLACTPDTPQPQRVVLPKTDVELVWLLERSHAMSDGKRALIGGFIGAGIGAAMGSADVRAAFVLGGIGAAIGASVALGAFDPYHPPPPPRVYRHLIYRAQP